jgi:myo-inositol-1(or 4)-monophosphatase
MAKPLRGRRICVTRPRGTGKSLLSKLKSFGADALDTPAIKTVPPASWKVLDAALKRLGEFDAVLFTSANAVDAFFERARRILDRAPKRPNRVFAVGTKTASALSKRGWRVTGLPEKFEGGSLAKRLGRVGGKSILIPRAAVAREILPRTLRRAGAKVVVAPAYRTAADRAGLKAFAREARAGLDWVTFTSASTVDRTRAALGDAGFRTLFERARAASIGPVSSTALRKAGVEPAVEANPYTTDALAAGIVRFCAPEPPPALRATLKRALHEAGKIVRRHFNKVRARRKGGWRANLITAADLAAEQKILDVILARFPSHDFLAEERAPRRGGSEYTWVIDPIDGTTNYAHGYPASCVSIGLVHRGLPIMGGIYDPSRDELFFAERGKGATLNGKRIRVSRAKRVSEALLMTGFAYDRDKRADFYLGIVREFLKNSHGIRRSGSAALDLAWTAAGRIDGYWEFHLNPWDVAAGRLIVEEAGGTVSDFSGKPWGDLKTWGKQTLASNGRIHAQMVRRLKSKKP